MIQEFQKLHEKNALQYQDSRSVFQIGDLQKETAQLAKFIESQIKTSLRDHASIRTSLQKVTLPEKVERLFSEETKERSPGKETFQAIVELEETQSRKARRRNYLPPLQDEATRKIMRQRHKSPPDDELELMSQALDFNWDEDPRWSDRMETNVNFLVENPENDVLTIKTQLEADMFSTEIYVFKEPFAAGSLAYCFYGKTAKKTADGKKVVLKRLKSIQGQANLEKAMMAEMRKNSLALIYQQKFNDELSKSKFAEHKIYFNKLAKAQIGSDLYLVEAYIEGIYEKYTDNFDHQNENAGVMVAFSHFVYERSGTQLMLCDLQGHNKLLTDATISSRPRYFEKLGDLTDIGEQAIQIFLDAHVCNDYCLSLNLHALPPRISEMIPTNKPLRTYNPDEKYRKCVHPLCNANSYGLSGTLCEGCTVRLQQVR